MTSPQTTNNDKRYTMKAETKTTRAHSIHTASVRALVARLNRMTPRQRAVVLCELLQDCTDKKWQLAQLCASAWAP